MLIKGKERRLYEVSLQYLVGNGEYLQDLAKESFHDKHLLGTGGGSARLSQRMQQVRRYHAKVAELLGVIMKRESLGATVQGRAAPRSSLPGREVAREVVNPGSVSPVRQSHGRGLPVNVNVG